MEILPQATPTNSALFVPSYPSGTVTSTVTLNFSPAVTNLRLAVWGLCNGCSSVYKYIYSFNVNGSPLGSLPSQTPYTTNSPLTQTTVSSNPAYTGNVADNNANAYLSFGNNVSSVSFNVQGTASMVIDSINFDYGTTVNAPIDLKETSQLKTFASEIEIK